jgi:hypothetical protein
LYVLILVASKDDSKGGRVSASLQVGLILYLYFLSASLVCFQVFSEFIGQEISSSFWWKLINLMVGFGFYLIVKKTVGALDIMGVKKLHSNIDFSFRVKLKIFMVFSVSLPFIIAILISL